MEIDPDLEPRLASPSDTFVEILRCTLDVRITSILLERPISYRDPNRVETIVGNFLEIC